MNGAFPFDELVALIGGRLGTHDVACPQCGPQRRSAANRRRPVLRIWHPEPGFVTFYCARCGTGGYAVDDGREPVSRAVLEKMRRKAEALEREKAADRRATARWLWLHHRPIVGTIAERYLREVRGIPGALPGTLGFLPADKDYSPALIAAFGIPVEPEPGVLTISHTQVEGVHLTRLLPDGLGKDERSPSKIMIAKSSGWPIVLAPLNDSGGLGIVEGIEDGLSVLAVTGLGVWAAGSASRLPALAERIPGHADCITIFAHDDNDGMRHAAELARRLRARRLFVATAALEAAQ
jgi:hypothetical protein